MKIKPLRSMVGTYGRIRRGNEVEIPDHIAQQLVKRGVAVPVQGKGGAGKASARPSRPPAGGRTGGVKRSSSSQEDQARETSQSKPRAAKPGS